MHEKRVLDWLLEKEQPAVRYLALTDLVGFRKEDPEVKEAYSQISKIGWAFDIINSQKRDGRWQSVTSNPFSSLYRPKYTATNWMSLILSDLGLTKDNPHVRKAAELFFRQWLPLPSMTNIFNDEVCIVGNTARMLSRFGYAEDFRVGKLYDRLIEDQKDDGGWHCFDSSTGSIDCWEALAAFSVLPKSKQTRKIKNSIERGVEFYLERKLFDDGDRKYEPWFRLHYPTHYYYDILVGLDVITSLGYGSDKRLRPALKILEKKRRDDGTWLLERVHPDIGKGALYNLRRKITPFALEKTGEPSKWITLTALRVLKRVQSFDN
ncbi:MAG TPA: hypothetical protein VLV31_12750 [Candidatus Acidoferrales bacterium]|nr:hypothetical protein [Candidatus Acidoferrales bacterium]